MYQLKTFPEAQRTQSIESITLVNLSARIISNLFQYITSGPIDRTPGIPGSDKELNNVRL